MLPKPYNGTTTLDDLLRKADEEKATIERTCKRSALFMSNLSRPATEGVYWSMAAAIIILAMAVGVVYSNNQKEYRYSLSTIYLLSDKSGSRASLGAAGRHHIFSEQHVNPF
jgi:hypothetical protein